MRLPFERLPAVRIVERLDDEPLDRNGFDRPVPFERIRAFDLLSSL